MATMRPMAIRSILLLWIGAFAAFTAHAQGRYSVAADGQQVSDPSSGLVWRRCAEGMKWDGRLCAGKPARYTFAGAKAAAKSAGNGWRLPTRDELRVLVDTKARKKPRIDGASFPDTPAVSFWATRDGSDDNLNAWTINFANGKLYGNTGQGKFPVRLVRSGG